MKRVSKAILTSILIMLLCFFSACKSADSGNHSGDGRNEGGSDGDSSSARTEVVLSDNGRTEYSIVIAENASVAIQNAANELQMQQWQPAQKCP